MFSLSPPVILCVIKLEARHLQFFPASHPITTTSRGKREIVSSCIPTSIFVVRKRFPASSPADIPSGFIDRTDLILKHNKRRRICHFIKLFLDCSFKTATVPQHCLPAFPSSPYPTPPTDLFSFLALTTICFALLFVHFLSTRTTMSTYCVRDLELFYLLKIMPDT